MTEHNCKYKLAIEKIRQFRNVHISLESIDGKEHLDWYEKKLSKFLKEVENEK